MRVEKTLKRAATRAVNIEKDIDVENRRVRFCFMTQQPCYNWGVPEVCLCEKKNVDLTRFNNGITTVLFNHDRDKVIGRIDKVEFKDKRAYAEVILDDDEFSESIFKKIQSGSLRGVSVGYIRQKTSCVEKDCEFEGVRYDERTYVTSKWELLEVSIVSIPADNDTGVGRDLGDVNIDIVEALPQNISQKEQNTMAEQIEKQQPIDVAAERAAACKAERERTNIIMALCKKYEISAEQQEKFLTEGTSVDAVRSAVLEILAEKNKPASVQAKGDMQADFRRAMADAMCLRTNVKLDTYAEGAKEMQDMTLRSMMEEVLERDGVSNVRRLRSDELVERAMGSGAFQGIIDDFANKTKEAAYKEQPFIFKNFVSLGSNKDFKPNYKYQLGLSGLPRLMPHESAEFTYEEATDARVSTMVHTYGKGIKFTREIFINDELGEVKDTISMQAGGFRRLQEMLFFQTLTGITFSAQKKNIVITNKDISARAYGEAKVLMMKQKDINNQGFIGVAPAFVLAPVEQENEHLTLLRSGSNPAQNNPNVINPVSGSMVLFTSPYLEGNAYYLLARPNQMRGIEFTTLGGRDKIESRTVKPSSYLGIEYQMWADFGFNVLSEKFAVKNPNA